MSEETFKVHIVKTQKFYEFAEETFDIQGFLSFQKALQFIHELADDMNEPIADDETEFEVNSTESEWTKTGVESTRYYIDDVEVEK